VLDIGGLGGGPAVGGVREFAVALELPAYVFDDLGGKRSIHLSIMMYFAARRQGTLGRDLAPQDARSREVGSLSAAADLPRPESSSGPSPRSLLIASRSPLVTFRTVLHSSSILLRSASSG
jgi:hypothetical protein